MPKPWASAFLITLSLVLFLCVGGVRAAKPERATCPKCVTAVIESAESFREGGTIKTRAVLKLPNGQTKTVTVEGGEIYQGDTLIEGLDVSEVPKLYERDPKTKKNKKQGKKVQYDPDTDTVDEDDYAVKAYHWTVNPVNVYINPSNKSGLAATAVIEAVKKSFSAWSAQAKLDWTYAGSTSTKWGGTSGSVKNSRNEVLFALTANPSNALVVASTYSWYGTTVTKETDVVFWNGAFRFFTGTTGCVGGFYVEDIGAHEFGHASGLNHSSVSGATMWPSASKCSQAARSLAADDISAIRSIYGAR